MRTETVRPPRRLPIRPLVAALAAAAGCSAWADEPNPYYIGVSEAVVHDSNVYRNPNGPGDTYSTTSLLGGFDQSIGRQRLYANARVGYSRYQDQSVLNNTNYGVTAGWDWATIEKLSGTVSLNANQSLASQNGNETVPTGVRNLVTTDQLAASAVWGGDGLLSLQGNYIYNKVRYSAQQSFNSESSGNSASAGVYYRVGPTLKAGVALRFTRTTSPYGVADVANPTGPGDYSESSSNGRNLDLSLDWRVSAQTGVSTRVSFTRQSSSISNAQDFSGLTGAVTATYAPTAKLSFGASFSRDTGTNSSLFNVPTSGTQAPTTTLVENAQTSDTYTLNAGYEVTSKIKLTAIGLYRHSKIGTSSGTSSSGDYTDNLNSASLGATYALARNWQLGCNLSHESRNVGGAGQFSYSANVIGCSAQFTLR